MTGRLGLDAEGLLPDGVVTDSDGRFRIEGLGRDVLASLTLSGPTIAHKKVRVLTRAMERFVDRAARSGVPRAWTSPRSMAPTARSPSNRTRPIEGFVRDAETKQPIPGAIVTAAALSGSTLTIEGSISTETDADGPLPAARTAQGRSTGHKLAVYPPFDRPYFVTRRIEAPATPGYEPLNSTSPSRAASGSRGR